MELHQVADNIRKENINILNRLAKVLFHMKRQEYLYALRGVSAILQLFQGEMEQILMLQDFYNKPQPFMEPEGLLAMLQGLMQTLENRDYVLLQDLLELELQPFIVKMQEAYALQIPVMLDKEVVEKNVKAIAKYAPDFGRKLGLDLKTIEKKESLERAWTTVKQQVEKILQKGYGVEYTSSGAYTITVSKKEKSETAYYYHNNGLVAENGLLLANGWFQNGRYSYGVIGMGLGYPVKALLDIDTEIEVAVIEPDENLAWLSCGYADLAGILETGRCQVILDASLQLLQSQTEEREWCVYYPAIATIGDAHLREQIEDYFINKSSIQTQRIRLEANFIKNTRQNMDSVDELEAKWQGKDLYIIAAGPSLDDNIAELKKVGKNGIILSTGTVMKKLLEEGIDIDYGILIDAGTGTYRQLQGIEDCGVPILVMSTVNHKVVSEYQGKKYLICQEGYKRAEQYAKEQGNRLYQTGGSVSTTALELGIRFHCRRIIFVGLDLAYTKGKHHASKTVYVEEMTEGNTRYVEDVHGKKVLTGKNLDIYRKWIEQRIAKEKQGIFIDATEGGARIKGTQIGKLSEVAG